MSTFVATELTNNQYLVTGTDIIDAEHQALLDGTEWNELKEEARADAAGKKLDQAISDFYAPLIAAEEELKKSMAAQLDPDAFIVEEEGGPGQPATKRIVRELQPDTVVLRLIDQGKIDRLRWVKDSVVVKAWVPPTE